MVVCSGLDVCFGSGSSADVGFGSSSELGVGFASDSGSDLGLSVRKVREVARLEMD